MSADPREILVHLDGEGPVRYTAPAPERRHLPDPNSPAEQAYRAHDALGPGERVLESAYVARVARRPKVDEMRAWDGKPSARDAVADAYYESTARNGGTPTNGGLANWRRLSTAKQDFDMAVMELFPLGRFVAGPAHGIKALRKAAPTVKDMGPLVRGPNGVYVPSGTQAASVPAIDARAKGPVLIEGQATREPRAMPPAKAAAAPACATCSAPPLTEGQARALEARMEQLTGRRRHHSRDDFESGEPLERKAPTQETDDFAGLVKKDLRSDREPSARPTPPDQDDFARLMGQPSLREDMNTLRLAAQDSTTAIRRAVEPARERVHSELAGLRTVHERATNSRTLAEKQLRTLANKPLPTSNPDGTLRELFAKDAANLEDAYASYKSAIQNERLALNQHTVLAEELDEIYGPVDSARQTYNKNIIDKYDSKASEARTIYESGTSTDRHGTQHATPGSELDRRGGLDKGGWKPDEQHLRHEYEGAEKRLATINTDRFLRVRGRAQDVADIDKSSAEARSLVDKKYAEINERLGRTKDTRPLISAARAEETAPADFLRLMQKDFTPTAGPRARLDDPHPESPCKTCEGTREPKAELKTDNPWSNDLPADAPGKQMTASPTKADVIELRPTPQIVTEPLPPIDRRAAQHDRRRREYEARKVQQRRDEMTLVKSVETGGSPRPLGKSSLILDQNALIALEQRAGGDPLDAGRLATLEKLKGHEGADLRIPEAVRKKRGATLEQFGITVDRDSVEYRAVLAELDTYRVGRAKGVEDRQIVADAFFANAAPGVKPVLLTADKGIYNPLLRMSGRDPAKLKASVSETFPDGFDVSADGRTIRVLPVSTLRE